MLTLNFRTVILPSATAVVLNSRAICTHATRRGHWAVCQHISRRRLTGLARRLPCSVSARRYSVFHTTNSADGRQTLLTAGKLQRGVASATVCHCSQFWATRDDAKLNTSRRIISCGLAAACVPIRRESNSISLQGNSQCIEEVSSFHL